MLQRLGRYQLVRSLATGGMAEVFHARTDGPGGFQKDVALKRVLGHLQIAEGAEGFAELFLDEARLAARLTHPNVVQVFDFGEADGSYFLAMELLDGIDLSAVLRSAKSSGVPVPLDVAVHCISEAAAGLHYAHTLADPGGAPLKLVHRDISPSNLFLTRHGEVKVLDFGIAKAEGQLHITNAGMLKGKHAYVPPEQIHGLELTAQADIWALGLTLNELCTGARHFERANQLATLKAVLEEDLPPPSTLRQEVPPALDAIVQRCVARDLSVRYQSAAAVRADLQDLLGSAVGRDMVAEYVRYVSAVQEGKSPPPPTSTALTPTGMTRTRTPSPFAASATTGPFAAPPNTPGELEPSSLPDRGVRGTLDQLSVADLVQMIEMGKKSAVVDVWPDGGEIGRLEFDGGRALFASLGERSAEDAFYALCAAESGGFHLVYQAPTGAQNLSAPTAFLLLEAMRRLDEQGNPSAATAPPAEPDATARYIDEVVRDMDFDVELGADLGGPLDVVPGDAVEADTPFSLPPDGPRLSSPFAAPATSDVAAKALDAGLGGVSGPHLSPFSSEPAPTPLTGTSAAALHSALGAVMPTAPSVKDLLAHAGPLPVQVVVLILRAVLREVAASYGDRRVAPSTVVLDRAGRVTLSHEREDDDDAQRAASESPEEASGHSLDVRSRLFSAATLAFEALTGQSPFRRASAAETRAAVREGERPLLLLRAGGAPVLLAALVERMWRTAPSDRPASAEEALFTLEPLALRLEQLYPGLLARFVAAPHETARALSVDLARRDVASAGELSFGSAADRRQAGFALLRARAACPDDGRAGARLLRMAQEEGWFVSGPPSSSVTQAEQALARGPYDTALLSALRREADDEGRFLHVAAALVRYTMLRPDDEEALAALRSLTGEPGAPFGVVPLAAPAAEAPPDVATTQVDAPRPEAAPTVSTAELSAIFDEAAADETPSSERAASVKGPLREHGLDDGGAPGAASLRQFSPPPRLSREPHPASHIDIPLAEKPAPTRRAAILLVGLVAVAVAVGGFLVVQGPDSETEVATLTRAPPPAVESAEMALKRQRDAYEKANRSLFGADPQDVARALQAVIEMDPASTVAVDARFSLAQAQVRAGDPEAAASSYRALLEHTTPDDERHQRALRLLDGLPGE